MLNSPIWDYIIHIIIITIVLRFNSCGNSNTQMDRLMMIMKYLYKNGIWCPVIVGQVLPVEVLRAPGPVESPGRPPSCHRCRTTSTIWLEETRRSSKNHLAENDWGGLTVTEFRGSHGMEEGKGEILGIRSSVRQCSARSLPPRRRLWSAKHLIVSAKLPTQHS